MKSPKKAVWQKFKKNRNNLQFPWNKNDTDDR